MQHRRCETSSFPLVLQGAHVFPGARSPFAASCAATPCPPASRPRRWPTSRRIGGFPLVEALEEAAARHGPSAAIEAGHAVEREEVGGDHDRSRAGPTAQPAPPKTPLFPLFCCTLRTRARDHLGRCRVRNTVFCCYVTARFVCLGTEETRGKEGRKREIKQDKIK